MQNKIRLGTNSVKWCMTIIDQSFCVSALEYTLQNICVVGA